MYKQKEGLTMELDLQVIRQQVVHATKALLEQANLKAGDMFLMVLLGN